MAPEINGAVRAAVRVRAHLPSGRACPSAGGSSYIPGIPSVGTATYPCPGLGPQLLSSLHLGLQLSARPASSPKPPAPPSPPVLRTLIAQTASTAPRRERNCFLPHLSWLSPSLKAGFCCFLPFSLSAPGLLLGPQLALTWDMLLIDSPGDLQATVGWFPVSWGGGQEWRLCPGPGQHLGWVQFPRLPLQHLTLEIEAFKIHSDILVAKYLVLCIRLALRFLEYSSAISE